MAIVLLSDMGGSILDIYDAVMREGVAIDFGGHTLHPVSDTVNVDASVFQNAMMGMNAGTIVVPDALVDEANLPLYYG